MVHTTLLVSALAALAAAIPQQAEHLSNAQFSRLNQVLARDASEVAARGISMDGSCGSASGLTCGSGNCCSSLGWCGATPLHCGTGCQAGFGKCGDSSSNNNSADSSSNNNNAAVAAAPALTTTTTSTTAATQPTYADKPVVHETTVAAAAVTPAAAAAAPAANSGSQQSQSSSQSSSSKSSGLGGAYKVYSGDGSTGAGWPSEDQWADFETMFSANKDNMDNSCRNIFSQQPNTPEETQEMHDAILSTASSSGIDSRFILAVVLQESGGCVRAPTTVGSVRNPGLMQTYNGQGTCNDAGNVQYPCPSSEISQMINDGTTGTGSGSTSLQSALQRASGDGASKYYRAARIYNSGSIDASGSLQAGGATLCYSSDIANRLSGWVQSSSTPSSCTFDRH